MRRRIPLAVLALLLCASATQAQTWTLSNGTHQRALIPGTNTIKSTVTFDVTFDKVTGGYDFGLWLSVGDNPILGQQSSHVTITSQHDGVQVVSVVLTCTGDQVPTSCMRYMTPFVNLELPIPAPN